MAFPFLVKLLLSAGPTLLRAIGQNKGGTTGTVAQVVADVIDVTQGAPTQIQQEKVEQTLLALPPEQLGAISSLQVELEKIQRERESNRLQAETAQHAETQATARIEAQSSDEYVRQTRPGLARKSFWLSVGYAFATGVAFPLLKAGFQWQLPETDPWILGALLSPALSYMGWRSLDAFSKRGKT